MGLVYIISSGAVRLTSAILTSISTEFNYASFDAEIKDLTGLDRTKAESWQVFSLQIFDVEMALGKIKSILLLANFPWKSRGRLIESS